MQLSSLNNIGVASVCPSTIDVGQVWGLGGRVRVRKLAESERNGKKLGESWDHQADGHFIVVACVFKSSTPDVLICVTVPKP